MVVADVLRTLEGGAWLLGKGIWSVAHRVGEEVASLEERVEKRMRAPAGEAASRWAREAWQRPASALYGQDLDKPLADLGPALDRLDDWLRERAAGPRQGTPSARRRAGRKPRRPAGRA